MPRNALTAAALLLLPALAVAAPSNVVIGETTPPPTSALALSRVIYLNRSGVTVTPGSSDARVNRSSVAKDAVTVPAWETSPEVWADTVACLENMFAPFDVTFTEVDPGATPHIEAVFGGKPHLFGLGSKVAGVAPLSRSCDVVENAMVFTFAEILVQNGQVVCETQAQEIAHAFGLDHQLLAADPMSYMRHTGNKSFQNEVAACGETTARPCGIGPTSCRAEQNSYATLMERLGASGYEPEPAKPVEPATEEPTEVGCSTSGSSTGILFGLAAILGLRRRRC